MNVFNATYGKLIKGPETKEWKEFTKHLMLNLNQKIGFSIQRMSTVKTLQKLEGKIFSDFFFFTKNM